MRLKARILCTLVAVLTGIGAGTGRAAADGPFSVDSDTQDGLSALRLLADNLHHRTRVISDNFDLGRAEGVLFEVYPFATFTDGELDALMSWVDQGGVLVYAAPASPDATPGGSALDRRLHLHPVAQAVADDVSPPGPLLAGVTRVTGQDFAPLSPVEPDQVPLLRTIGGNVMAVEYLVGRGRVVSLRDPWVVTNGDLGAADNGVMAADLIDLSAPGTTVRFDEYHHGAAQGAGVPPWWTQPWGVAILLVIAIFFTGFFVRGRAFGTRIPRLHRGDRSSAEYATAVGAMLRRAGARQLTLSVLVAAARRALAARIGMRRDAAPAELETALDQRAPNLAAELRGAQDEATGEVTEGTLLKAARRLHSLAYPESEDTR